MEWHELYEKDFYAWAMQNAHFLRQGDLENVAKIDKLNIVQELEQIAMREKRYLVTRLSELLVSLLRWQVQSLLQSESFKLHIEIQRTIAQFGQIHQVGVEEHHVRRFPLGRVIGIRILTPAQAHLP